MAENVEKIISIQLRANEAINGLKDLNTQIETNKARMKELAAANQKGSAEYAKLEQHTKALSQTKQYLSRETQNEIRLQYEEEGSLRQLRAELSKATKEFDQLSRAERESGARGKELKDQINRLTTEIKAAEEGTQRYYRNVGNYRQSILEAIGVNGRWGQSILNLTNMEGGFSGAMSAMGSSIKAFGASLMSLMANPVFWAIAGIAGVGMAFKWFYDYNEGLAEATRLTREFTGYMGDDLIAMRNSIQATADVMDKEFIDVLNAADSLMQNFKIDGETAMNIINQGFAAGGDLNGDMLDKIQRLAPAFKNAGMSAEQLVALITQTRSGIFTDQGLDAIAMGTSRIRQFSDSMKKALQGIGIDAEAMGRKLRTGELSPFAALTEISAKLKELSPNTQEYGEVVNAVFGKAGKTLSTEMVQGLADMSTSLDEAQAKTGQYGELLLENIKTEQDLNNATSALFDMTNKGWEEIKQKAIIYAKKGLVAVVKGIVDVVNWYVRLYNRSLAVRAATNYIIAGFKAQWAAAKLAFNLIIDGIKSVGRGLDAMVTWFSSVGKAISSFGQGVYKILYGIANRSLKDIKDGYSMISKGVSANIKTAIQSVVGAWSESVNEIGGDLKAWGGEMAEIVMDGFYNTLDSQMNEVHLPNFSGGGGGGGSNNNLLNLLDDKDNNGGSKGGSGGSSGSGGGSNTNKDAEAEKKRLETLNKQLMEEAKRVEQNAMKELSKQSEQGIIDYYAAQEQALREKYKDLGNAINDVTTAEGKAFKTLLDANAKAQEKALIDFRTNQQNQLLQNQINAETDAKKRHKLELQQLDNRLEAELKKVGENAQLRLAVTANFAKQRADMEAKFAKEQLEQTKKLLQTQMEAQKDDIEGRKQRYELNKQLLDAQMQEELAQYERNEAMRTAIKEKYLRQQEQLERDYSTKEREIQMQRYEAMATMMGGLGQLMGEFGEENKAAAIASKVLALGEIMISQAVAIANAVKAGSNAITPWQMIAQIATSVTAVTVAMAQAFKSLNSAKFATGGYISGAGTGTSDSIPVRVSNGESIMNANTTAMFGGLLSSLNQLGGGVPIQAQETASSVRGEDMLARAVARGVAMLPNPVVSVEDINRGQRQVEVMNERATL